MKKQWAIIGVAACGIVFFLVDLWLQKPLSTEEMEVSTLSNKSEDVQEAGGSPQELKLEDDTNLDQTSRKLEQVFRSVLDTNVISKASLQNNNETSPTTMNSPWVVIDKAIDTSAIRLREDVKPIQLIQINLDVLRNLQIGDSLDLPPIDEKQYKVSVTKNKTLWNGDSSIAGNIRAKDGDVFPVTILQGDASTFASISTPKGSYEVEAFGTIGGVYSVTEMDQQTFYAGTDELTN